VDSTGLEADAASLYFATRHGTHRRQAYPKLSVSVVIGALVAARAVADWGACNDKIELPATADGDDAARAGRAIVCRRRYDAEWVHEACRGAAICSWIPPVKHRDGGGSLAGTDGSRSAVTLRAAMGSGEFHQRAEASRWRAPARMPAPATIGRDTAENGGVLDPPLSGVSMVGSFATEH